MIEAEKRIQSKGCGTKQPPAKAGGLGLRTESPDTGRKTRC